MLLDRLLRVATSSTKTWQPMRSSVTAYFRQSIKLSMIRIDLHVGGRIPGELDRSAQRKNAPGLFAPLVSEEGFHRLEASLDPTREREGQA